MALFPSTVKLSNLGITSKTLYQCRANVSKRWPVIDPVSRVIAGSQRERERVSSASPLPLPLVHIQSCGWLMFVWSHDSSPFCADTKVKLNSRRKFGVGNAASAAAGFCRSPLVFISAAFSHLAAPTEARPSNSGAPKQIGNSDPIPVIRPSLFRDAWSRINADWSNNTALMEGESPV